MKKKRTIETFLATAFVCWGIVAGSTISGKTSSNDAANVSSSNVSNETATEPQSPNDESRTLDESRTPDESNAAESKTEINRILDEPFAGTPEEYPAFLAEKGKKIGTQVESLLAIPNLASDDAAFALKNGLLAIRMQADDDAENLERLEWDFLDANKSRPETKHFYRNWIDSRFYDDYNIWFDSDVSVSEKQESFRRTVEPLIPLINEYFDADRDVNQQLPSVVVNAADRLDPDASAGLVVSMFEKLKPVFDRDLQLDKYNILDFCAKRALGATRRVRSLGKPLEYEWPDCDGNLIQRDDFKEKVVLLLFTQPQTKRFVPVLRKIDETLRPEGLTIVWHDLDANDVGELREKFADAPLPWVQTVRYPPNCGDRTDYAEVYGIRHGEIFLTNRDGIVVATRSDGVTPELCESLKSQFPNRATEIDGFAEEIRAVQNQIKQEQENDAIFNFEKIKEQNDDSVFGRLLRLQPRLNESPPRMRLELDELLLTLPEAQESRQTKEFLLVHKGRYLLELAHQKAIENPTISPETFYEEGDRFAETIFQDETIRNATKNYLLNRQLFCFYSMLDYLKSPNGNARCATKIVERLVRYCRNVERFADMSSGDSDLRSRYQPVHFAAAALNDFDQANGTRFESDLLEAVRPIFAASPLYAERETAKYYEGRLRRLSSLGKEFELRCFLRDGSVFDVRDYRGKIVLVNFWGTTCGPCLREFPNMKTLYEKYRDRGYEMVAISADSEEDLDAFLAKNPYPWKFALLCYSERQKATNYFEYHGISAIPVTFLLDRDGIVRYTQVGSDGEAIVREVDRLFAE